MWFAELRSIGWSEYILKFRRYVILSGNAIFACKINLFEVGASFSQLSVNVKNEFCNNGYTQVIGIGSSLVKYYNRCGRPMPWIYLVQGF